MSAAERNVPSIYSWLEAQVNDAVRANNLTQVIVLTRHIFFWSDFSLPCVECRDFLG